MSNDKKENGSNPAEIKQNNTTIDLSAITNQITTLAESVASLKGDVTKNIDHMGNRLDGIHNKTAEKADSYRTEIDTLKNDIASRDKIMKNLQTQAVNAQVVSKLTADGIKPAVADMLATKWVADSRIAYDLENNKVLGKGKDASGDVINIDFDTFYSDFKTTDMAKDFMPADVNKGGNTKLDVSGNQVQAKAGGLTLEEANKQIDALAKDKDYATKKLELYNRVTG